ncbi:MAG TPA: methyltransferase [Terriglobales bacterium]|nr:methyltransferase [Terriglobales bacterium]
MSSTATTAPPTPERIFETINAFQRSEALKGAIELDLFTAIAEGNQTADEIARRCRVSERGSRILCDYLVVQGLLTKNGDHYGLTPDTAAFLNRKSPSYIGTVSQFLLSPRAFAQFTTVAEAVRKGGSVIEDDGLNPEHPMWIDFARAMAPLMIMPAQGLARTIGADRGEPWKVLGLAVGHGMYEITIAQQNPAAEVWVVDWANVLQVAQENAAKAGVSSRYHTIPGSAFEVDYGRDYDVAVITNFLHHFDTQTNERLLRKVHAALKPGGRVVVLDFVPNPDRVSPPAAGEFALIMLVATPSGDTYTFAQYEQMLKNAGFRSAEFKPLPQTFFGLAIGHK